MVLGTRDYSTKIRKLKAKIEAYKKDSYFAQLVPLAEQELQRLERVDAEPKDEAKKFVAGLLQAESLPASMKVIEDKKVRGVVVQRIGMFPLRDGRYKFRGFFDICQAVVLSKNQRPMRVIYVHFKERVNSPPGEQLSARLRAADLVRFVDNYLRWGEAVGSKDSGKLKVFHPELWERFGNHKLARQRPISFRRGVEQ